MISVIRVYIRDLSVFQLRYTDQLVMTVDDMIQINEAR